MFILRMLLQLKLFPVANKPFDLSERVKEFGPSAHFDTTLDFPFTSFLRRQFFKNGGQKIFRA